MEASDPEDPSAGDELYLAGASERMGIAWDEEMAEEAFAESEDVAERDPEAALYLQSAIQHGARMEDGVDAGEEERDPDEDGWGETGEDPGMGGALGFLDLHRYRQPFDPMRMLADLAHHYHWDHLTMMRIHWPTLQGYYREAIIRQEEEQEATQRAMQRSRQRRTVDADAAAGALASELPQAVPYDGPTVQAPKPGFGDPLAE